MNCSQSNATKILFNRNSNGDDIHHGKGSYIWDANGVSYPCFSCHQSGCEHFRLEAQQDKGRCKKLCFKVRFQQRVTPPELEFRNVCTLFDEFFCGSCNKIPQILSEMHAETELKWLCLDAGILSVCSSQLQNQRGNENAVFTLKLSTSRHKNGTVHKHRSMIPESSGTCCHGRNTGSCVHTQLLSWELRPDRSGLFLQNGESSFCTRPGHQKH